MATDTNLQFIKEKINQIRTAVMYTMSNSLVKLPNDLVTLVRIDEEANLWFLSRQPNHLPDQCETEFPARLCFYRKGINYFVEVSGKASVINNSYQVPEKYADTTELVSNQKPMLVKMSMVNVEYNEPHAESSQTLFEGWLRNVYKWILKHVAVNRSAESILSKLHKTN
jgi:general stress protein 26